MNRFIRRVAIAVVSPALAIALAQGAAQSRPGTSRPTLHTATSDKVCIMNPVWGDRPCLF